MDGQSRCCSTVPSMPGSCNYSRVTSPPPCRAYRERRASRNRAQRRTPSFRLIPMTHGINQHPVVSIRMENEHGTRLRAWWRTHPPEETFGQVVRELREARGWSQRELAEELATYDITVHQSTIAKIEAGARPIRLNEALAISALLGVPSLVDLLSTAGPNSADPTQAEAAEYQKALKEATKIALEAEQNFVTARRETRAASRRLRTLTQVCEEVKKNWIDAQQRLIMLRARQSPIQTFDSISEDTIDRARQWWNAGIVEVLRDDRGRQFVFITSNQGQVISSFGPFLTDEDPRLLISHIRKDMF